MRRCKGTYDILFGVKHRMRKRSSSTKKPRSRCLMKEQSDRSQEMKEEFPKHGSMCEEVCESSPKTSGTQKAGPRNEALMEAVVKQVKTTRHPWLTACHAKMCPEDFKKSFDFKTDTCFLRRQEKSLQLADPEARIACLLRELTIMLSPVIAFMERSRIWTRWKGSNQDPHKTVTFLVERDKEFQVLREQKMPKTLPGFSGGKPPGRSKVVVGREGW